MDTKLADRRNDEHSCDNRDVTKLPLTVPVEDRPASNEAETGEQGDVTKLPWTTSVNG